MHEAHDVEEERYRTVFRRAHADHAACAGDEWLHAACRARRGRPAVKPLVWSRRNGPWHRVPILWVGAAPGNAGGLGSGTLGAHGTRIPFGGDIAGGNLDVLLSAIGTDRNETFIVASLNQLPAKGGGEPTTAELAAPVGAYPDSVALLRDTVVAAGPTLIVALGNVALRTLAAALTRTGEAAAPAPGPAAPAAPASRTRRFVGAPTAPPPLRLPSLARLTATGFRRGAPLPWPDPALPLDAAFTADWRRAWDTPPRLHVLPLLHPSAQNMSPFAGTETVFHTRMLETRDALRAAVHRVLGRTPPAQRPFPPDTGIYALPEWQELVAPAHQRYDELWRQRGV